MKILSWSCLSSLALAILGCQRDPIVSPQPSPAAAVDQEHPQNQPAAAELRERPIGEETATPQTEHPNGVRTTQVQAVCEQIIHAAARNDAIAFKTLYSEKTPDILRTSPLQMVLLAQFATGKCLGVKINGETATVVVQSAQSQQEVPFVHESSGWKLDTFSYVKHYPLPKPEARKLLNKKLTQSKWPHKTSKKESPAAMVPTP